MIVALNMYLKYSSSKADCEALLARNSVIMAHSNWLYILGSALLVDEFYPLDNDKSTSCVITSIKSEFKAFVYSKSGLTFLTLLFDELTCRGGDDLIKRIQEEEESFGLVQLNHLSFCLTRLVDLAMAKFNENVGLLCSLNRFAQSLVAYLVQNK